MKHRNWTAASPKRKRQRPFFKSDGLKNFSLSISISDFFVNKFSLASELSDELNKTFAERKYGDSIAKIEVGFLMVLRRPGYEDWYKPKRLSYTEYKDVKSKLTGLVIEKRKVLSFEVIVEHTEIGAFHNGTDINSKLLLLSHIIKYLKNITKLPTKVKDFRLNDLVIDLEKYETAFRL